MRKLLVSILAISTIFTAMLFSGCTKTDEDNTLRVGLECAYAPFNWTQTDDSNGAVAIEGTDQYANGYDVQIAKKIAQSFGKDLVICKTTWDGLIPAVKSGAIDMIIAGMSPTAERRESIDFSDAYYTSNLVIVVNKDGKYAQAQSLKDFEGAKIVGQLGTFHETAIDQIPGVLKQTSMKDFGTMIVALKSGSIDGYVAEEPTAMNVCGPKNPVLLQTAAQILDLHTLTLKIMIQALL